MQLKKTLIVGCNTQTQSCQYYYLVQEITQFVQQIENISALLLLRVNFKQSEHGKVKHQETLSHWDWLKMTVTHQIE